MFVLRYMDIIEAFQPDIYQMLCDGDTNLQSSKKRIQKSVERTSSMFEKCLQRHQNSEVRMHFYNLISYQEGRNRSFQSTL